MYSFMMLVMILMPQKVEHRFDVWSPAAHVSLEGCYKAGNEMSEYIQSHLPKKAKLKKMEGECRKVYET